MKGQKSRGQTRLHVFHGETINKFNDSRSLVQYNTVVIPYSFTVDLLIPIFTFINSKDTESNFLKK